jgi:cell division protein FtsW
MHRHSIYLLVLSVATLVALGMVMLFSTSSFAQDAHGNPDFFIKRQAMWLAAGFIICIITARVDYHRWQKAWWLLMIASLILLALCFIRPIGQRINGSSRWVKLGPAAFQPSELAKLAAVCSLAWWLSRDEKSVKQFWRGFIIPAIPSLMLIGLIAPEVDLGSTALIGATTFAVMYVGGVRLRYLLPVIIVGVAVAAFAITKLPNRMGRMLAFMYPEKYPADAYQTQQGLIAFGSGGVEGLGLGNGRQKAGFLPFAHTDFILPTIGEELGLRFTLLVVFTYIIFIFSGTVIAIRARDRFGLLFGVGFVVIIALQAAVNIGVTTSMLPNKGLPLPLISYGGSNLVFCMAGVGVLINIYRQGTNDKEAKAASVRFEARLNRRRQPMHRV